MGLVFTFFPSFFPGFNYFWGRTPLATCLCLTQLAFQGQLDYTARHIEEEKRERIRMREQLAIQNEIINKLYARLNQVGKYLFSSSLLISNS